MNHDIATKHRLRLLTYLAGFFLSFATAIGAYINSSFIERFVGTQRVGLVYSIAAIVSLLASWQGLRLLRRFGNRLSIIFLSGANFLTLLAILLVGQNPFSIWLVATYIVLSFLTAINLDVYLEELSDDRTTGRIRGLFLTLNNLAWLLSPFLAGQITAGVGFSMVYAVAALALLPLLFIAVHHFQDVVASGEVHLSIVSGLKNVFAPAGHDLRRIITLDFLLNFFYAVMIIYLPIYLHEYLGFAWTQIGLIFTVMLLPFVLLGIPLGRIADLWWGERELLVAGFLTAAIACLLIGRLVGANAVVWALVLFLSRVGAATIETMRDTYLFKIIDGRDANIVFISRNMYPLAYVLAPITASLFLLFLPLSHLFTFLGLVMLLGLPVALKLKDTR